MLSTSGHVRVGRSGAAAGAGGAAGRAPSPPPLPLRLAWLQSGDEGSTPGRTSSAKQLRSASVMPKLRKLVPVCVVCSGGGDREIVWVGGCAGAGRGRGQSRGSGNSPPPAGSPRVGPPAPPCSPTALPPPVVPGAAVVGPCLVVLLHVRAEGRAVLPNLDARNHGRPHPPGQAWERVQQAAPLLPRGAPHSRPASCGYYNGQLRGLGVAGRPPWLTSPSPNIPAASMNGAHTSGLTWPARPGGGGGGEAPHHRAARKHARPRPAARAGEPDGPVCERAQAGAEAPACTAGRACKAQKAGLLHPPFHTHPYPWRPSAGLGSGGTAPPSTGSRTAAAPPQKGRSG